MPVIVRRRAQESSGELTEVKEYRSRRRLITQEEIAQAEELDRYLAAKMQQIYEDLRQRGLLQGKRGNLERWHAVGRHLSFVDDESVVPPEDRNQDRYIWEAVWAHAPEGVRPGPRNSRTGTLRDHFRECYQLARIPLDTARQAGNWSDWVNFLETPAVMQDKRIIEWVAARLSQARRSELRHLTTVLRRQFDNRNTTLLTEAELKKELEQAWEEASRHRG